MSKIFNDLLSSEDLTLKTYSDVPAFESLATWQKARLALAHTELLLAMIRDRRDLDAITKCISDAPQDLEYYTIPYPDYWLVNRQGSIDRNWNLRYSSVFYQMLGKAKIAHAAQLLYTRAFDSLAIHEQFGTLLTYPSLLKRFVRENRLVGLEPKRLSFLVTCLCIVAKRLTYGANLSTHERDTLCVGIAREPLLLARLLPAARIILLARFKQMSADLKLGLPKVVLDAAEQAYDLPLALDSYGRLSENGIKTLRAFWLPTIVGMSYENDYCGRFSDVLDCAHIRNNWYNTPKIEAEALSLAVVLDPRFVNGFPNSYNPSHPWARLSLSDRSALIAQHNLTGQMRAYEALTKELSSVSAGVSFAPVQAPASALDGLSTDGMRTLTPMLSAALNASRASSVTVAVATAATAVRVRP